MNKKIIILAVLVVLAVAYAVMKKDVEPQTTPVAVEEVIANEEAAGVPTPDVVVEEEGVVVEEVMPAADEVAPVAEEPAPVAGETPAAAPVVPAPAAE